MRWSILIKRTLMLTCLVPLSGCAQFKLAINVPQVSSGVSSSFSQYNHVRLVSSQAPDNPLPAEKSKAKNQVQPSSKQKDDVTTNNERDDKPPTNIASTYTSPSLPYQQLAVAVVAIAVGIVTEEEDDLGRELSESIAFSNAGSIGRLGLTATPTRLAGRVTSRPGLQEGPATGLGFAAMDRNIFTPQINRLSGTNGRCQDLARAGFFSGNRASCERSFRRR